MPAPKTPKPPALCACGCGEALPAVRRADRLYVDLRHWDRAHPEKRRARDARQRKRPGYKAWLRQQMRKWRKKNPERWREIRRRAMAKLRADPVRAEKRRAAQRAAWRRKAAEQAKPQRQAFPPALIADGLRVARKSDRLSDWREDAAQDRVLRELERRARGSS